MGPHWHHEYFNLPLNAKDCKFNCKFVTLTSSWFSCIQIYLYSSYFGEKCLRIQPDTLRARRTSAAPTTATQCGKFAASLTPATPSSRPIMEEKLHCQRNFVREENIWHQKPLMDDMRLDDSAKTNERKNAPDIQLMITTLNAFKCFFTTFQEPQNEKVLNL
jgi:hypothetical protein